LLTGSLRNPASAKPQPQHHLDASAFSSDWGNAQISTSKASKEITLQTLNQDEASF